MIGREEIYPQRCLLCAATAWDNSCGHFTGPTPTEKCRRTNECDCRDCRLSAIESGPE